MEGIASERVAIERRAVPVPRRVSRKHGLSAAGLAAVLSGLLLLCEPATALVATTTTLTTYRFWDGSTGIGLLNADSGLQTMGQTITPEINASLLKFMFWVKSDPAVKFRGYVYRWDPDAQRATGAMLWSGVMRHTKDSGEFERIILVPRTVPVVAGKMYVVLISTLGITQREDPPNSAILGFEKSGSGQVNFYDGGFLVYDDNADSPADWTTRGWLSGDGQAFGPGADLTFQVVLQS